MKDTCTLFYTQNKWPLHIICELHYKKYPLTRGELADVDNVISLLGNGFIIGAVEWRTRQGHETSAGGLEDTEGSDQLQEGLDSVRFGGAVCVMLVMARKKRKKEKGIYDDNKKD